MSNPSPLLPAIAPANGGALITTTGPQRIAMRMAENLLSVARNQEQERALVTRRHYRIGAYEFLEADHTQIQHWARRLGMEPEKVVEVLASSQKRKPYTDKIYADFQVADGAIVSLVWDFELLPLTDWAWVRGLQIVRLGILNAPSESLPRLPECLHELFCDGNQLAVLDLTPVPGLQTLECFRNQLTVLDLTPVPGLQTLDCSHNQLTKLDLNPVPSLEDLSCSFNELTELDLTPVPRLKELWFWHNRLTELDLTPVPDLHMLWCKENQLTELDLTPVPGLEDLMCDTSVNIKDAPPNLTVYRS